MASESHEIRVWWDGSGWRWTAWHGGRSANGTGDDSLDARLKALEWIGQQDRPSTAETLEQVAQIRVRAWGRRGVAQLGSPGS